MQQLLWTYPVATLSTAAFYGLMLLLAIPATRGRIVPWLAPVPPHQKHLQSFDTFRGFAAFLVAIGHAWWASYPVFAKTQYKFQFMAYDGKAVPMFAVLSGFLIYRSVLNINSIQELRSYVVRRFFRIYPTYLLSIALCLTTAQYVPMYYDSASTFFLSDLLMFKVLNRSGAQANPVTWSLYIEVAFYVALPLFALTLGRRRAIIAAAIGVVLMTIAEQPGREFSLWTFFLIGILASELSWTDLYKQPLAAWLSLLAGLGLLVYDFGGPDHDWMAHLGFNTLRMDYQTLGLGLGCSLLLAALPHVRAAAKALEILPLRLLGVTSYSLYITHFFYILANFPELQRFNLAGTPDMYQHFQTLPQMPWWYLPFLFMPGCILWAIVSYVLVERPGMALGRRLLRGRKAQPAIGALQPAE